MAILYMSNVTLTIESFFSVSYSCSICLLRCWFCHITTLLSCILFFIAYHSSIDVIMAISIEGGRVEVVVVIVSMSFTALFIIVYVYVLLLDDMYIFLGWNVLVSLYVILSLRRGCVIPNFLFGMVEFIISQYSLKRYGLCMLYWVLDISKYVRYLILLMFD